jgi:hypothetical protein
VRDLAIEFGKACVEITQMLAQHLHGACKNFCV